MDVDVVIAIGLCHQLTDVSESSEVHNCVDLVRTEGRIEGRRIPNVPFDQGTPAHKFTITKRQIVKYNSLVPGHGKRLGAMAAYIASTAGDENARHLLPCWMRWDQDR